MKTIRILLAALLAIVSVLYGITFFSNRLGEKNTPPSLSCSSTTLEVSVNDGEEVLLSGLSASDDQDGDLTSSIRIAGVSKFIREDTAKITYVVFDQGGNVATLSRYLHYTDYESPRFSITAPLNYKRNSSINLLERLKANDAIDGDITDAIRVSSMTATSDPETYTVEVQVTNSMGDTSRLTIPVIQTDGFGERPEIVLRNYLIYMDKGSYFDARSYLLQVSLPKGTGDLQDVTVSGAVDTSTPGTYMVRYSYSHEGTSGYSILTVVVE